MAHRFHGSNWVEIDRSEVPHGGQERRQTEDSDEDDSGGKTGGALVQKLHKKEGKLVSSSTEIEEQQREGRTAKGSPASFASWGKERKGGDLGRGMERGAGGTRPRRDRCRCFNRRPT